MKFVLIFSFTWFVTGEFPKIYHQDFFWFAFAVIGFYLNKHEPNISSLLFILAVFKGVEIAAWQNLPMINAYVAYPLTFLIDAGALYFILKRNELLTKWELKSKGSIDKGKYIYTNADYVLSLIYKVYILIIFLMFGEHLLRHLDHLGLPPEWNLTNLMVIYENYTWVKRALNAAEYTVIIATASKILRSGRYVAA